MPMKNIQLLTLATVRNENQKSIAFPSARCLLVSLGVTE
jgi:hypothetical protein